MRNLLGTLSLLLFSFYAGAARADNELDREVVNHDSLAKDLPATVVVRIDERNRSVAVFHSEVELGKNAILDDSRFVPVKNSEVIKGELDDDSSTPGWYFYWYNYSFFHPTYYYAGFNFHYRPYHGYYWNHCNYFWYRW